MIICEDIRKFIARLLQYSEINILNQELHLLRWIPFPNMDSSEGNFTPETFVSATLTLWSRNEILMQHSIVSTMIYRSFLISLSAQTDDAETDFLGIFF